MTTFDLLLEVAAELRVLANLARDGTPERKDKLLTWATLLDAHRQEYVRLTQQLLQLGQQATSAERWVTRRQLREQMTAAALTGILSRDPMLCSDPVGTALQYGQLVASELTKDSRSC